MRQQINEILKPPGELCVGKQDNGLHYYITNQSRHCNRYQFVCSCISPQAAVKPEENKANDFNCNRSNSDVNEVSPEVLRNSSDIAVKPQ